jgi:Holliday junction resolvasome RuvABC endonuclease subunit
MQQPVLTSAGCYCARLTHAHQASNILKDTTPQVAAVEKAFLTAKLAHDLQVRECVYAAILLLVVRYVW